ncbi:MAG TPA: class I SAM-dependent methyltransferase, partial [Actinomycetota bacterium]|nr:class I SAM-dependent methyltransferase [Actinomycetota bacterium]
RIALLETAEPDGRLLRLGHRVYFRGAVPAIGGLLSNREAYSYLPRSTVYLPAPEELLSILRGAGFPDARRLRLAGGITQLLVATRG